MTTCPPTSRKRTAFVTRTCLSVLGSDVRAALLVPAAQGLAGLRARYEAQRWHEPGTGQDLEGGSMLVLDVHQGQNG